MLPPAVSGEHFRFDGLGAYTAGSGRPLLLIHSVNAAASAAEVRPLYELWKTRRQVFAIDLPGYGSSDRSNRAYTPRVMTDALHRMGAEIRRRCGEVQIDALAVSLGCEFLARAAAEKPGDWGRIALVSPTALNGSTPRRGAPGTTRKLPLLQEVLSVPLWSGALFNGLTRPGVVRYFLERTWGGKNIDEAMYDYAVRTAREPGAKYAPLYFLGGGLFSADAYAVYESLPQRVWASHGVRGDFTDYRAKAGLERLPNWQFTVFETGAMPYFEVPEAFDSAFTRFLE